MNIPKEAIEKAIAGGWNDIGREPLNLAIIRLSAQPHEAIALDPAFWQGLGKALGWKWCDKDCDHEANPHPVGGDWKRHAKNFYDLILTGGDTAQFWKEILKKNQS